MARNVELGKVADIFLGDWNVQIGRASCRERV